MDICERFQTATQMDKRLQRDTQLVFTSFVGGVCHVNKGDTAVYLGQSQARITSGPSKDWLVWLTIDAPVAVIRP